MDAPETPGPGDEPPAGQFGVVSVLQWAYLLPALAVCLTVGVRVGWAYGGAAGAVVGAVAAVPLAFLTVTAGVVVTVVGACVVIIPLALVFDPETRREARDAVRRWRAR